MEDGNPEQLTNQYRLLEAIYDGAIFVSETLVLLRPDRIATETDARQLASTTMLWHANLVRHLRLGEQTPGLSPVTQTTAEFELATAYLVHRAPFSQEDMAHLGEALRWDESIPTPAPYTVHGSLVLVEEQYRQWLAGAPGTSLVAPRGPIVTTFACRLLVKTMRELLGGLE